VGGYEKIMNDETNIAGDRHIPVFFEISSTDKCVCGACTSLTEHEITNKTAFRSS